MKPKILLVNPPIYDFTAYDFWIKPYGMLSVAGYLKEKADFVLFDYLDRLHLSLAGNDEIKLDKWGLGRFPEQRIDRPECLSEIPRHYRRCGLSREIFIDFLLRSEKFDFAFVQTMMSYWYLGVKEIIEDIRKYQPQAKIILGGNYVTLCPEHAESLRADFLSIGCELGPLWEYLNLKPDLTQPAIWGVYDKLKTGAIKITDGCPFSCTYCSVPKVYGYFKKRSLERAIAELKLLVKCGAADIAFYDDALLYKADEILIPFLNEVIELGIKVNFHTPNALNARFITKELAEILVRGGFKTFYLGFESSSAKWQNMTGSKVYSEELAAAVENLKSAGADCDNITAYQILGHPNSDTQQLEESMHFVSSLGIRGMLADFSPIPGTPDGDACSKWVDLTEPLLHNKTAFAVIRLGFDETNRLKDLQRALNRSLKL